MRIIQAHGCSSQKFSRESLTSSLLQSLGPCEKLVKVETRNKILSIYSFSSSISHKYQALQIYDWFLQHKQEVLDHFDLNFAFTFFHYHLLLGVRASSSWTFLLWLYRLQTQKGLDILYLCKLLLYYWYVLCPSRHQWFHLDLDQKNRFICYNSVCHQRWLWARELYPLHQVYKELHPKIISYPWYF